MKVVLQRMPTRASASLIALALSASVFGAPQEIPTTPFAAVQRQAVDGLAVPGTKAVTRYAPGRVLIQISAEALSRSSLERTWRADRTEGPQSSGLVQLDAALTSVGVTAIHKAYIETQNVELGQDLGLDRWYLVTVNAAVEMERFADRLKGLADVEDASPDWRALPADIPNDPLHGQHWGHNNTGQSLNYCWGCGGHDSGSPVGTVGFDSGAHAAWDEAQGYGSASVVIGIIDSGVEVGHPDLRQVAGFDYGDNDSNADDNSAEQGHGTACAGVAAAINGNGQGSAGIAGGCSIMPLKVANSAGDMFFSAISNALIFAADNGADVASLSLGAAISNDPGTSSAITYANSNGVTVLAATANGNASTLEYPANHALVIGVGAASPCGQRKRSSSNSNDLNPGVSPDPNGYTCDGERWWGSNYGSTTQDSAGAVDVLAATILPTTDILGSAGYANGAYSSWFNGTSCSTPYAAGVCALIKSANPTFTPAQVRSQLVNTCDDVTGVESGTGWDRYSGYGMVNAAAAVDAGPGGGVTYAALPYTTGFESTSLDSNWTTTESAEGRILQTTANGPYAGARHMTMDDSVNGGAYGQNEADLHLDLSGETQVSLSFRWKEFGDETHPQDGVYFSDNAGLSFAKVHSLDGSAMTNNTWTEVNLDLDSLAGSAGLALTSTFVVKLQQYDNYGISSDGMAFDDLAVEQDTGGGPIVFATLPYSTGFETGAVDSSWSLASSTEGRILVTAANGPFAGSFHMTMDDNTNAAGYGLNEANLHLNLAGESQVSLRFQWIEFGDETHPQDGVYFSDNGGVSFTKVFGLDGSGTADSTWSLVSLDLDSLAQSAGLNLTSTFVVKIQQYDNYGITTDGMGFDEFLVEQDMGGGGPDFAPLPYLTGFEAGSLDGNWITNTSPEGRIQVTPANGPFAGSFHMTMDDSVNASQFGLNEGWMRLDLAGHSQVDLAFQWKDFGDETHPQDGVFFSDDAGTSFVKVYGFDGSNTTNNVWNSIQLDLDSLAATSGLSLTSTFVVKFQQFDNYGISSDGMGFDDVAVTVGSGGGGPMYAPLPYSTGFESGNFDANWVLNPGVEGRIQISTANNPFAGARHLVLDDAVNASNYSQNEAWMRLDLSASAQATLNFEWQDIGEETHPQDGVYLSDNGGLSFVKVHGFDGSATANGTWTHVTLDLDQLAISNNLALSSTFVVKFQQFDNYGAPTDGLSFDAIMVD